MNWIQRIFRRNRLADEAAEEIQTHLDEYVDQLMQDGISRKEATLAAHRAFGNVTRVREISREVWGWRWLDDAWADVKFAARSSARTPTVTVVSILTLALGIGVNTAFFAIAREVLLSELPVRNPSELVELQCISARDVRPCGTSYAGFVAYAEAPAADGVLDGQFAFSSLSELSLTVDGRAEFVSAIFTSASMYDVLGIPPFAGQLFADAHDRPDAEPTVILSYAYWQRRFGGSPQIIGRPVAINGLAVTVIGVAPASFRSPRLGETADVTLPIGLADALRTRGILSNPAAAWLSVVARRKPDVSSERVQAALEPIFINTQAALLDAAPASARAQFEELLRSRRLKVTSAARGGDSSFRNDLDQPVRVLAGLSGAILLMACANLASLLLSRSVGRRKEFATRCALGAGRGRLLRQLVTENLFLSAGAAALALLTTQWLASVAIQMIGGDVAQRAVDVSTDAGVVMFVLALSLLTGCLVGAGTLLHASRTQPFEIIRQLPGQTHAPALTSFLVAAQMFVGATLLVGASLFAQTLSNLRAVEIGFAADGLTMVTVNPALAGYDAERVLTYADRASTELRRLRGVEDVTFSSQPMGALGRTTMATVPGFTPRTPEDAQVGQNRFGPDFVRTLGLTLIEGRDFAAADSTAQATAAIVNESFVRHFMVGGSALGRQFSLSGQREPFMVIGVVKDARDRGVKQPVERVVYTPMAREVRGALTMTMRSSRDLPPKELINLFDRLDSAVPIYRIQTMQDQIDSALRRERLLAVLGSAFAGLAAFLVAIGLYGMLSAAVGRRTREIGLRMAVGASRAQVGLLIARRAVAPVAIGLVAGLAGAYAVTPLVKGVLVGVNPSDPTSALVAVVGLLVTAAVAVALPTLKAIRIEPTLALRQD